MQAQKRLLILLICVMVAASTLVRVCYDTNQHVKQYEYNIDSRVRERRHEKQRGQNFVDAHPLLGYDWKNDGVC